MSDGGEQGEGDARDRRLAISLVAFWASRRWERRTLIASSAAAGFLSLSLLLRGHLLPSTLVTLAYCLLASWSLRRLVRTAGALASVLQEGLRAVPSGLDDPRFTLAVFTRARIRAGDGGDEVRAKFRAAALWLTEPGGPLSTSNCSQGHPPICAHRSTPQGAAFWRQFLQP